MAKDRPRADTACPVKNGRFTSEIAKRWAVLLEFDRGAGGLELLLDFLGLGLGGVFLDVLGRALDEVLGLLEAEARDRTDFLDDANLVRAGGLEDDGELGLRFGCGRSGGSATRGGGSGGSGGGNAPLAFEIFDEGGELQNGLRGQPLDDLVFGDVAHDVCSLGGLAVSKSETRLRDVSPSLPRWMFFLPRLAPKKFWLMKSF